MGGRRSRGSFKPGNIIPIIRQVLADSHQHLEGEEGDMFIADASGEAVARKITGDVTIAPSGHALVQNDYVMNNFVFRERALGSLDGINKTFSVLSWPLPNTECVFVDGVLQDANSYRVSGSKIIFNEAPTGDTILVNYVVPSGGAGS